MASKLLIVSNFYPPSIVGGAEVVADRHARLLKRCGWEVKVLSGALPSSERRSGTLTAALDDGIEILSLTHRSLESAENFRWPLAGRVLQSILSTFRPDWVHFHNVMGLGVDLIRVAKECGVRTAVTLHDHWGYCYKNTRLRTNGSVCGDPTECHLCQATIDGGLSSLPMRFRQDYVLSRLEQADILISPSRYLANCYSEGVLGLQRVQVQSNGINLQDIQPRARNPGPQVKFLCAAYLGEHKGIPVLLKSIQMLEELKELKGRWSVTIAGHGHLADAVTTALGRMDPNAPVEFVGRLSRSSMMKALDDADVVVLPSVWPENEPVTLLEGIASGAAILATRIGGNVEIVEDGRSGILVSPNNPEHLAQTMRRLILEPHIVAEMSQHNLSKRASLDEHRAVDRLHSLFSGESGARRDRNRTIICWGRTSAESTMVLATLTKALSHLPIRLIWMEWAEPSDWLAASGFWCWNEDASIRDLLNALNRQLPIILPDSVTARTLGQASKNLRIYRSLSELWDALAATSLDGASEHSLDAGTLMRLALRLQPMEDFRMTVSE